MQEMTSIIVFGKPRAFESYEYVFGGDNLSAENVHSEPILKPKKYEDSILHYFVREGYAGLEYYTRAKGYESERDGIVFGVALKSTSDFNIIEAISKCLGQFWSDFASALLDEGRKFKYSSIIDLLKKTQWTQTEIETIKSTSLPHPIKTAQKKILLLVSPELDDINLVEPIIKEYKDVYMADNPDVFKEQINGIVLKEAGNQIYQIIDGKIEPLVESEQSHPDNQPYVPKIILKIPTWGKRSKSSGEINNNQNKPSTNTFYRKKWGIVSLAIVIVAAIFASIKWQLPNTPENQTNEGQVTSDSNSIEERDTFSYERDILKDSEKSLDADKEISCDADTVILNEYSLPIKNNFALNPQIYPTGSSNVKSDIDYFVSQPLLVHIDKIEHKLIVDKRPSEDTKVTVKAYIGKTFLAEQKYTIAKAESKKVIQVDSDDKNKTTIPSFENRPIDIYLNDLEKDLTKSYDFVIEKCNKIINSNYESKWKDKANKLKSQAEDVKRNSEVKSAI